MVYVTCTNSGSQSPPIMIVPTHAPLMNFPAQYGWTLGFSRVPEHCPITIAPLQNEAGVMAGNVFMLLLNWFSVTEEAEKLIG